MQIFPIDILHGGGGGDVVQPGGVPAPLWLHLDACASGKFTIPTVNVINVVAIAAISNIVEVFMTVLQF